MKNIARIYIRQSGREKGEKIAPEAQKEHCERVAKENGWRVVVYDEGEGLHSAYKRTALPQWEKLFRDTLSDKSTVAVIAYDLARSFRNSEAFQNHLKQLLKAGIRFITAVEGEADFNSADNKMMWGFRSEIAEYESRKTSERLLNYHARLRKSGIYTGHRALAGLTRTGHANDGTLKFIPNETMRTVMAFLKLYAKGNMGVHACAHELNRRGLKWTNDKMVIPTHLRLTLAQLEWYQPHISKELYQQVTQIRARRAGRKENGRQLRYPALLLWRLLYCAECGGRFMQDANRTYGARYKHTFNLCRWSNHGYTAQRIEQAFWKELQKKFTMSPAQRDDLARVMAAPPRPENDTTALHLEREKISAALDKLKVFLVEGDIDQNDFRALKEKYNSRLEEIHAQLKTAPVANPLLTIQEARAYLDNIGNLLSQIEKHQSKMDAAKLNALMRALCRKVYLAPKDYRITKIEYLYAGID